MKDTRASSSFGFTLIELLVVIAIITILAAMMMPAIQSVRESGRRVICQSNIKQIGLAVLNYEQGHQVFPPSNVAGRRRHSWAPFILSNIGQPNLASIYHWEVSWDHPDNQQAINTKVEIFRCPSAGPARIDTIRSGITSSSVDYAPVPGFSASLIQLGLVPQTKHRQGIMTRRPTRRTQVFDGMSQSILFVEDAGRPGFWTSQGRGPDENFPGGGNLPVRKGRVRGAGWADVANPVPLHGFTRDGLQAPGSGAINRTNNNEAFGFHTGGVFAVFADGHVQFLSEQIDISVYAAIITREGADIVKGL